MTLTNTAELLSPRSLQDYIEAFLVLGLEMHPVRERTKLPAIHGWQNLFRKTSYAITSPQNIGVLTGVKTARGYFTVVDLDLDRTEPISALILGWVLAQINAVGGPHVKVHTGGKHRGVHLWLFTDSPATEKIRTAFTLHHCSEPILCEVVLSCRGGSRAEIGFNVVAPGSYAEAEYVFAYPESLEDLPTAIKTVKLEELLSVINAQEFAQHLKILSLATLLRAVHKENIVTGYEIELAFAAYADQKASNEAIIVGFQIIFGDEFDFKRTESVVESTARRLEAGETVTGIGTLVQKLEGTLHQETLKRLLSEIDGSAAVTTLPATVRRLFRPATNHQAMSKPETVGFYIPEAQSSETQYLIPEVLPAHSLMMVHGPAGHGKTTAAVNLAEDVLRRRNGAVIYLDLEGKASDINEKLGPMEESLRKRFIVVRSTITFQLAEASHQRALYEFLRRFSEENECPALIIIDSLMAMTNGELISGRVGGSMLFLNHVAGAFGSVLVLHHNTKAKSSESTAQTRVFGSALITGAVVLSFEIERMEKCRFSRRLRISKSNIANLPLNTEIIVGRYPGKNAAVFRVEDGETSGGFQNTDVSRCRDFLMEILADGEKHQCSEIDSGLAALGEFPESAMRRAIAELELIYGDETVRLPRESVIRRLYIGE